MTRIRVRNPQGQYGTIDPDVGVSSFVPEAETAMGAPPVARAARRAIGSLDDAGGMIGGIVGGRLGPQVGVGGAALGGMAGRSAENFLASMLGYQDVPQTPLEVIQSLSGAGMEQGALEAGGRGTGALLAKVGRGLGRMALRPSPALVERTPEMMSVYERERIPVGGARPRIAERVNRATERVEMLAANSPARFTAADIAREAIENDTAEAARGGRRLPRRAQQYIEKIVQERMNELLASRRIGTSGPVRTEFTASELLAAKRAAREALDAYYNKEAGGAFAKTAGREMRANKAIGAGAQRETERAIPEMAGANQNIQDLMGLQQALIDAESRNPPTLLPLLLAGGGGIGTLMSGDSRSAGGGLGAAALAFGALHPRFQSRAGFALTDPLVQEILRQTPRALWAGLGPVPNPESR